MDLQIQEVKHHIKSIQHATENRILRRTELEKIIGLSRSAIYSRLDPKSPHYDASFPTPIKLGTNAKAIGWLHAEVIIWVNGCIAASRGV